MPNSKILINGAPGSGVSAADRGLAFGDGLFETIAYERGRLRFYKRHYLRLKRGCKILGIPVPDQELLLNEIRQVVVDSESCIVKIILTRGQGGFGYQPSEPCSPTRIVRAFPWPESLHTGQVDLHCDRLEATLGCHRSLAGLKHLNRLEQVLAAREVATRELDDGLLCNEDGFVLEATSSNLLFVFNGAVSTPKLDTNGVHGVLRDALIELFKDTDNEIRKEYIYIDTAVQADEIILCSSVRGLRRVATLADRPLEERTVFNSLTASVAELLNRESIRLND